MLHQTCGIVPCLYQKPLQHQSNINPTSMQHQCNITATPIQHQCIINATPININAIAMQHHRKMNATLTQHQCNRWPPWTQGQIARPRWTCAGVKRNRFSKGSTRDRRPSAASSRALTFFSECLSIDSAVRLCPSTIPCSSTYLSRFWWLQFASVPTGFMALE